MRGYVLLLVASATFTTTAFAAPPAAAPADSCAVLPFSNAASKHAASVAHPTASNADWLGVSIAETLRDALELHGLVTLSRDDLQEAYRRLGLSFRSQLTQASVMKIGETLDAEQVIYGDFEVQPAPPGAASDSRGSLKISARILDRRRLRQSGEFAETGAIEDLSTIEAHLAWRAMVLLAPDRAPQESEFR
jgi:hypothetical protein